MFVLQKEKQTKKQNLKKKRENTQKNSLKSYNVESEYNDAIRFTYNKNFIFIHVCITI